MMKANVRLAVLIALPCLVLAGCGEDDIDTPTPDPVFESVACNPASLPAGQDPAHVTCGFLTVPENRTRFTGRTIKLAVVVLRATGANPEPDPVVFLSGGPGQWALDGYVAAATADFAAPIQEKRDMVIFDQRGTGHSEPALNCPEVRRMSATLAALHSTNEDAEIAAQNLLACHDRMVREGIDLSGYSSAATAQDIADLMTTLGYERFNLYGLSYGTRVALTALRDLRDGRIRSVVLDSVFPPQVKDARTGSAVERSSNLLIADCAADLACNRAFPNLREVTYGLIDHLNAEPLELDPTDPTTGEPFHVVISGDRFVRLAELGYQSAALIPFLPLVTVTTASGNAALLTAALGQIAAPELYSPGLQTTVLCNEETPLIDSSMVESARAQVNPLIVRAFPFPDASMRACPQWGVPLPDPIEDEAVHSDVPALILAGEYDTSTPPDFGLLAAETLPNSHFFQFRGLGHIVLFQQAAPTGPPACAMQVMAEFLDDPTHAPDGSCVAALPPPQFVVP